MTTTRTYLCLPGAWMGAWSWKFVLERLHAAGHDARALPFRGVGERAAELSPELDNDVYLADTLAYLEEHDLREVVLVGHSFGSLIASLITDRMPGRIGHLVIIDGGIAQDGQSIFGRIPPCDRRQAQDADQDRERHRSAALRAGRQPDHRRSGAGRLNSPPSHAPSGRLLHQADPPVPSRRQRKADDLHRLHQAALSGVGRHA